MASFNKKLIALLLFGLLFSPGVLQAEPYKFLIDKSAKPAKIELEPYFFIHHINFRILETTGAGNRLNNEDRIHVISGLINLMSFDAPGVLVFPDFKNGKDLKISFQLKNVKGYTSLVMTSNLSVKDGSLLEEDSKETYATMFHIIDGKTVHYSQLFSAQTEKDLTAKQQWVELADSYIMDERTDNDGKVKMLLDRVLADEKQDALTRLSALLSKGQIEIVQRRLENAEAIGNEAEGMISKMGSPEMKQKSSDVLAFYRSELNLMKELRKLLAKEKAA